MTFFMLCTAGFVVAVFVTSSFLCSTITASVLFKFHAIVDWPQQSTEFGRMKGITFPVKATIRSNVIECLY
jgi:uncharacterized membrane protein